MNVEQRKRIGVRREVALQADRFYDDAQALGKRAAEAQTKRSQISGLEAIVNSADKTSDVFDFIKLRVARHKEWRKSDWGADLLDALSKDLRKKKDDICKDLEIEHQSLDGLEVHLLLMREFVCQMAAHYEYAAYDRNGGLT